jgi:hypothetical protein
MPMHCFMAVVVVELQVKLPTSRERAIVHSLISRTKVIVQDQKDFSKEIKNMSHDLLLNEYP